jgi:hypothetical protein
MRQLGRGVKIGRRRQIGRLDLERGERGDKKVPSRSLYHATRAFNSPLIDICNKVQLDIDTRAFPRFKKEIEIEIDLELRIHFHSFVVETEPPASASSEIRLLKE